MDNLDPSKLTPGVLDIYAHRAFKYGACAALAIALHDRTHWDIIGITEASNVHNGRLGGGSCLHWAVKTPDGEIVDIDGIHTPEDLLQEYHAEADQGVAAIGVGTRADATEWYVEAQGEQIPIELAAKFVDAVLAKYFVYEPEKPNG